MNGHTTKVVTTTLTNIAEGTSHTTIETTETFPDGTCTTSTQTYTGQCEVNDENGAALMESRNFSSSSSSSYSYSSDG